MKIKKIKIQNFKSIKELEIESNEGINAFIGKNGTGKSAVFDAINIVLGETYPTANTFQKDYFNNDEEEVVIEIEFYEPYYSYTNKGYSNTIKKLIFKASCKGGKLETSLKKGDNESYNINGEDVRDPHRINYIGSDRTVKSIMPTNSWSLLGRQFYSADFFTDDIKEEFEQYMNNAKSQLEKSDKFQGFMKSIQEKLSNQINRPDIKSEFTMYDTTHFLKTLEFYVEKNGKKINLTNEGSGIQNSFILATLQTLSETDFRKNGKQSNNPIFIDEPELYLHPHAKKSLYNTFKKLSDSGTQIFYITHSAEFLSYENSEQIHKFYVDGENGTKNKKGSTSDGLTPRQQMIEPDKISFNNAFFADTVFLVEGYTDEIFLRYILQNKNPNRAIEDFNISIVNCSSKDNIIRFYNLYKALGIECYVLYDKDATLPTKDKKGTDYTKDSIASRQTQRDSNNADLIKCNGYGFEENLEHFLTGDLDHHLDNDKKRDIVQTWIESVSTEQKQSKIDEIYNEIVKYIPSLETDNARFECQDSTTTAVEELVYIEQPSNQEYIELLQSNS